MMGERIEERLRRQAQLMREDHLAELEEFGPNHMDALAALVEAAREWVDAVSASVPALADGRTDYEAYHERVRAAKRATQAVLTRLDALSGPGGE
jgi:hypothetical protein